jgi:hypothetical protein
MRKSRSLRRRPSTPNLTNLAHEVFTADPASPPETPTTSPEASRKSSLKPRHQPPFFDFTFSLANDPSIRPVGNGHGFSYRPTAGPEQLSPRSSASSDAADSSDDESSERIVVRSLRNSPSSGDSGRSDSQDSEADESMDDRDDNTDEEDSDEDDEADEDEDEEDDEHDVYEVHGPRFVAVPDPPPAVSAAAIPTAIPAVPTAPTALFELILEELDPMDSDWDALDILQPYEIESSRSRSSSWHKDLDRSMMRDLRNLNCSNEVSDEDDEVDCDFGADEIAFLKRQQELKRIRRVSMSSSFGKRTISELSDSDNEDYGPLDVNEVGSSARRLRKMHRTSLLFNEPPEQIEELEEPNSSEDEFQADDSLAQELPYWTMEIMEVESD